eukprot:6224719-Amphidinium_carterae.1
MFDEQILPLRNGKDVFSLNVFCNGVRVGSQLGLVLVTGVVPAVLPLVRYGGLQAFNSSLKMHLYKQLGTKVAKGYLEKLLCSGAACRAASFSMILIGNGSVEKQEYQRMA